MKYTLQLLYIVLAIYLTFAVWVVDADLVSQFYFNPLVQMTYIPLYSVEGSVQVIYHPVLVPQEAALEVF